MGNTNQQPQYGEVVVHDEGCEKTVLGTLMAEKNSFDEIGIFLSDDCFYEVTHKDIYKAIKNIIEKNDEPNILTVFGELQRMGSSVSAYEVAQVANASTYDNYLSLACRLRDLSIRRKLWELGGDLRKYGISETEDVDSAVSFIEDTLNKTFDAHENTIKDLSIHVKELFNDIDNNLSGKKEMSGIYSGFKTIDSKGGLQPTDLIIVAGETSMGKTSFALSLARNAVMSGHKVAIYSKEMTGKQIAARLISMQTGCIPSSDILYSTRLGQEQIDEIVKASDSLPKHNVMIDERSTSSVESVLMSIRSMVKKEKVCGVVIDYLQLFDSDNSKETREQFIGRATRRFKNVAKDLNIFVILISQLNRADNPYPTLSRLRESGQIADAADVIMLLYRPEYYRKGLSFPYPFEDISVEGKAMIDVAKGRNIGTRQFIVNFNSNTVCFSDLDNDENDKVIEALTKEPEDEEAPF